jgi:hypothetical protein
MEANEHFTRVCNQNNDPGYNVIHIQYTYIVGKYKIYLYEL